MLPTITPLANLLVILPLSLAVMEESSGRASGECESACARLCCSKLYSLSSASNVPVGGGGIKNVFKGKHLNNILLK